MPIKSGSKGTIGSYFGSTPIIKMYRGSNLVFQKVEEETNPLKALIERTIKKVDIELSDELTSIGQSAFNGCTSLTNITIPSSVTSIGAMAFYNCTSLVNMTILATTPPNLYNDTVISTATTTIYVPSESLSAYQTASLWADLTTRETNPVTFIGI